MTSAADLRAGLSAILAGGDGSAYPAITKGAATAVDPFSQPNEWEQQQRRLKKEEQKSMGVTAATADSWQRGKPKSRRAQQEVVKATKAGAAAKEAAKAAEKPAASQPTVAPAEKQLLPACSAWWEELQAAPEGARIPDASQLGQLRARAALAYEAELGAFAVAQKKKHGKDQSIVQRLTSAGTIKDRIAALTVQVHESSFHCLPHLRQLISLAERPRPEVRMAACETLSDLLLQRLMPQRVLKALEQQPLPALSALPPAPKGGAPPSAASSAAESAALTCLLQSHYESELKEIYARFYALADEGAKDTLPHIKQRMIGTLYALLAGAPELERKLLASLVNKLGDPDKKAASRIAHLLGQLTIAHPAMKSVVLAEIQRFVLRPNVSEGSQYYAVVFMNQLILTRAEPQLAHTLVLIFLALFSARTAQGAELGTRMLSSVLSGLHRAIPFCDDPATRAQTGDLLSSQLTSLFRCAHAASFGTAVQALMVLSHATAFTQEASDRFYRALYASLLHPDLPNSSKQALLLNVVFKALKADESHARSCAFAKRLLQACAHAPPSFICGVLLLLSEFATQVAKGEPVSYAGDPLRDFGLMPFLDKFVFKNPKSARRKQAGGSIMQPAAHAGGSGGGAGELDSALSNRGAVANLLNKPAAKVAAHERFFHTYFSRKREAEQKLHRGKPGKAMGAGTESSVGDDDDGTEGFQGNDLDAEGEAFAQRLAKSLMRDADPDDDDDDFDVDDDDDDEEGDDDDGEEGDDDGGEFDDEIPEVDEDEDDEDEDDARALAALGDEGADEDEKPKRRKKRDKSGPKFADAAAFAHILEEAADENEGVHPSLAKWESGERKKRKH